MPLDRGKNCQWCGRNLEEIDLDILTFENLEELAHSWEIEAITLNRLKCTAEAATMLACARGLKKILSKS